MRIELTLKNYRCFTDKQPARIVIENGLIAFVGVNNAGKSTLLRFLYEFRQFFRHWTSVSHWGEACDGRVKGMGGLPQPVRDPIEIYNDSNERPLSIEIRASVLPGGTQLAEPDANAVEFLFPRQERPNCRLVRIDYGRDRQFPLTQAAPYEKNAVVVHVQERVSLRNYLEAMGRLGRTLYVGAFRNLLNTGSKSDYFDIQVGDAFIGRWRTMSTGNSRDQNLACQRVESSVARLLGYRSLSIQAADSNDTLHVIADGRHHKLHELGSGMAQCIMVLVNAAVAKPGYILIDEPELHLHPSLQIDFLTALAELAEYGVLFSTHSIGLARATADRIYSVVRQEGVSRVEEFEGIQNLPEFLGALSYSSYHALGFDKVLLVEGPTEVLAFQRLLRKIDKDHKVLLLPLGGSALINGTRKAELNEVKRITQNVSAIIDSEKADANADLAKDRKEFHASCTGLQIPCHVLERRALDNYLTDSAVKRVKGEKYRALTDFEKLTDVKPSWGKNENWRILGEMTWDDVKNTDLGQFLSQL